MLKLRFLSILLVLWGCEEDPFFNSCRTNSSAISPSIATADSIRIFMPTAFTPNGDGLNDNFYPTGGGIESFTIVITHGNTDVFSGTKDEKWNGTDKKNNTYQGNYDYEINVVSMKKKKFNVSGTVSLITDPSIDVCLCRF
ncbi:MAG: gliding motility-associated C-terminal domain-containing protein [Bacteroidia bacterium]|nr:gliding motility-associated C-terminal domain-containing protein [Bacteroidia bacterium]NNJ55928.1 hypothetical protein [Bacteroidia bacterium]